MSNPIKVVAVDIGNSRAKWGLFCDGQLAKVASFANADQPACFDQQIAEWQLGPPVTWAIASVNEESLRRLESWLDRCGYSSSVVLRDVHELPIRVELEAPERVGMDRILDAVAANARRPAGRSAVIVDAGSAITVDAVAPDGSFVGGSIAAGFSLAARALHQFTSQLPLVSASSAPPAIGKSTVEAIQSGLFWGSVGAVKELVARISQTLGPDPIRFVSGGDGDRLAQYLERPVHLVPHLTLEGIYIAYEHRRNSP